MGPPERPPGHDGNRGTGHHEHLHVLIAKDIEGVLQHPVEERRVAGPEYGALLPERETQPPREHVQPLLALVTMVFGGLRPLDGEDHLDGRKSRRPRLRYQRLETEARSLVAGSLRSSHHRPRSRLAR